MINTCERKKSVLCRALFFGKSMAMDMLAAYYDRSLDTAKYFDKMKISESESYREHLNQYDVLKINMQDFLSATSNMDEMLEMLQKYLIFDLLDKYETSVRFRDEKNLIQSMKDVYAKTGHSFVILIDEWDCLFREHVHDKEAQRNFQQ